MSYTPIVFVNDTDPFIDADNLNYIQQGILIANNLAKEVNDAYESGELKGAKGDKGDKGVNGTDGRSFEISGFVEKLADLPPPSPTYLNQIWVTYEFGHLHFCDGSQWIDWGQFVGVQGEKGDSGDFDVNTLTSSDIQSLHDKLTPLNEHQNWSYQTYIEAGKTARFKVADLNLDLSISRVGATVNYRFYPNDTSKPSLYYVNRLSNYDAIAWESTYTTNWQTQAITASGFVLDPSGYLPGREQTFIQVIDHSDNTWYTLGFIGLGEGTMFIDVKKRVDSKRQIITAV